MKPLNMLLLSSSPGINLDILYCLAPLPHKIYVVSNQKYNVLKYSRHKYRFDYLPWDLRQTKDSPEVADLRAYCDSHRIDFILPGDMAASGFFYNVSEAFDDIACLPVPSPDVITAFDDKWVFADHLMRAGLATPKTRLLSSHNDLTSDLANDIGFPAIVKPLRGSGSEGVHKLESLDELRAYFATPIKYNSYPQILQQYIDGPDVDLSFISDNGKIVTAAVQRWLSAPDLLDFEDHAGVSALAEAVVDHFKFSGPGHFDMRIEEKSGKVFVIECNPRFWGSVPAALWCGKNFVEEAIAYSLGQPISPKRAEGTYMEPAFAFRTLLRRPWKFFDMSNGQRRGMMQPFLDPIPQLMVKLKGW